MFSVVWLRVWLSGRAFQLPQLWMSASKAGKSKPDKKKLAIHGINPRISKYVALQIWPNGFYGTGQTLTSQYAYILTYYLKYLRAHEFISHIVHTSLQTSGCPGTAKAHPAGNPPISLSSDGWTAGSSNGNSTTHSNGASGCTASEDDSVVDSKQRENFYTQFNSKRYSSEDSLEDGCEKEYHSDSYHKVLKVSILIWMLRVAGK